MVLITGEKYSTKMETNPPDQLENIKRTSENFGRTMDLMRPLAKHFAPTRERVATNKGEAMRWKCKIITTHRPTLPDEYAACAVLESGVVDCPAETTAWYGTEKEAMDALEGELSGHFWWETKEAK